MTPPRAALPLVPAADPVAWMSQVLAGWGLPGGLARGWMPVLTPVLAAAAELVLEHDADLGLVSLEARDASGAVLVGLDDLVGSVLGGVPGA